MITLDSDDILKYEKVGSGKFGSVYRVSDDTCYKIYHAYIPDDEGIAETNPARFKTIRRINRIKKRQNRIDYTGLPRDVILINGVIGGVVIPYYDGCVLNKLEGCSYSLKKEITRKLLRNHKELLDHRIYPTDYHVGNVIVVGDEPKLIDLDDPLTHTTTLPNHFFKYLADDAMYALIYKFFDEYNRFYNTFYFGDYVDREKAPYMSKHKYFETFFKEKEKVLDYILIDKNSFIDKIKDVLDRMDARVLFLTSKNELNSNSIYSILSYMRQCGIPIFDIVDEDNPNSFFEDFPVMNKVYVKENRVIKK